MTIAFILFVVVLAANLIDCIDAIITGRELGQELESARLRNALYKLTKYWLGLLLALLIDIVGVMAIYKLPYLMMLATVAMLFIEGRSMLEHARRRKDKTAKIPEVLLEIVRYIGEDKVKEVIIDVIKQKATSE
ncbi:MAG: phage holin family protein [Muribaculaceae bacterium]|nr:phage holin family protein [Muribaculaceae bacterium]